ncbi:hypothetical protein B0A69_20275 [Chryseobacterium shigense]|uniref:DUF4352 domain-containing protein n=1 Tax=Chryseobacterium shigense TaxID=297244 RepID=A0A1N7I140_9FLAO|nr:hypothetical protein [Chryseobacterium shigense]PQA90666.1 hypothetical protein B0A69_20275 [Chryseobacterium shigense]SIS30761.1 hypothetical protein SAMN05421639_1011013 [Chryseobacterium shigense]
MKNLAFLFSLSIFLFFGVNANAQKISDGQTVEVNGMSVTFNILNKESIEAGGKPYDRYKVSASVKNTSDKAYNIRLSSYPQIVSNIGLVELDCINATGAKLTSKKIELKMKVQMINVTYSAYDKSGKFVSSTIPVTGSYYFDSGDTISDHAIFIVPQGQAPDVTVRSLK